MNKDLRKDSTFKGFETFWNNLQMTLKMHLHICLFIIFLQLLIIIFSSIIFNLNLWINYIKFFIESVFTFESDLFTKILLYFPKLLFKNFWIVIPAQVTWFLYPKILKKMKERAKKQTEDIYLAGSKMISHDELNSLIRKNNEETSIKIGQVNFPVSAETKHTLVIGRTGTGKTVCLSSVIENLRERGKKGIIYDLKGDYVARFYDQTTDLIFNPLDARGIKWNLFNEIKTLMDIKTISSSLIPEPAMQDPFWNFAARDVFAGILLHLYYENKRNTKNIWPTLTLKIEDLAKILQATKGAESGFSYIQDAGSKQALGVIATLMVYASCFQFMQYEEEDNFSIQGWLQNKDSGFIFVTNYPMLQQTLKPILSLFIDLFSQNLLSLKDDASRRIFVLLDEFGTLQKLSSIKNLLTLSRSKGGSVWVGIQDSQQIQKIYGTEQAAAILNSCSNSIIFAVADPKTAEYLSMRIGESEISHVEETYSMGVADNRDGLSLIRREKIRRLVLPSELLNLKDLHCFVKLANYDITKTIIEYKSYSDVTEPFVLRSGLSLKELVLTEHRLSEKNKQVETQLKQYSNKRDIDIAAEIDILE